jgi:hypothetical protein
MAAGPVAYLRARRASLPSSLPSLPWRR